MIGFLDSIAHRNRRRVARTACRTAALVLVTCAASACSKQGTAPTGDVAATRSHGDAGGTGGAAARSRSNDGGSVDAAQKGRSDAGKTRLDGGSSKPALTPDGGEAARDAATDNSCGGLTCPAPMTCDRSGAVPSCVCPAGYMFVDLGGNRPPCFPRDDAG